MAGWNSSFVNAVMLLLFQTTTISTVAQNAASTPITNVYLSLHTATPAGGNQTTSEAGYTSYARVAEQRNASTPGFTVASNVASLAATANFPTSTGSPSETETFLGIGTSISGTGALWFYGAISPTIAVTASGVTPQITACTVTGT